MPIIAMPINICNKHEINRFYRKTNLKNNIGCTSIGNIMENLFFCYVLSFQTNDRVYCDAIDKWCSKDMENVNKKDTIFRNINTTKINSQHKFNFYKLVDSNYNMLNYPNIKDVLEKGIHVIDTNVLWFVPNKYLDKIQKIFEPDKNNLRYIYSKYKKYLDRNTCSIHYRTFNKEFNTDVNKKQLISKSKSLINVINNHLKSTDYFLVFSDDMIYTKEFIRNNFKQENFIFINERDYLDLWIMSLCKNNIGFSDSTFFKCAAILNKNKNKQVSIIERKNININHKDHSKYKKYCKKLSDYNLDKAIKEYKWKLYHWEFDN